MSILAPIICFLDRPLKISIKYEEEDDKTGSSLNYIFN